MDNLSVCGVRCSTDCKAYGTECAGCIPLEGKVSWAVFYGKEHCPIYDCVTDKGLPSCGDCGQAPCDIWVLTRNPDASDEEYAADINNRLQNLSERGRTF
jgi:hypothetical protein